jgi:hypothetical protein
MTCQENLTGNCLKEAEKPILYYTKHSPGFRKRKPLLSEILPDEFRINRRPCCSTAFEVRT